MKGEGPGRGWWGPPKGTHTGRKPDEGEEPGRAMYKLSPEVRQQAVKDILQVQRYGIGSGNEAATAIDRDGKRIDGTPKGDESTCDIGKLLTGKEHVLIHNHPNSVSFSNQDVAQLWTTKAQHLVVVGHDGTLYRLSKTPGAKTPPLGDRGQFASLAVLNWGRYVGEHENKFTTPVGLGQMSKEQAWKEQTHLGMVDFANAYNLDYERMLP